MHNVIGVFEDVVVTLVLLSVAVDDFLVGVAVKLDGPIDIPVNE